MALVDDKYTESTDGIKKTIDKQSMGMALDILQRGLYAYPIQSTVRELASNGYDAIKERETAKAIILGTTKIEDHFDVTKIDGVYHASGWDPTYFDLSWLSDDPHVYLYYEEGEQKDTLRIVDHGVGLGKKRLVNYFMLNWSSKRSNKDSLGRFGLGSKVALSLGVDSFRVITKYNGKKFKFDVFLDKVESIISKFGPKGQVNEPFVLVQEKTVTEDDGTTTVTPAYVAYCEPTTDKNGVEIQIEVKKHNKKLFFDAIEAQLMYMPNMKFMHRELGKSLHVEKPIAAKILYRDDNVIISESTVFDRPHILLGTGNALINYGFVSFKDLEIEPKRGSVGLIMDINDIEVTPSRESPLWSAKTRAAVLEKYKMVSAMASKYLNNELASETDYLKWILKSAQIIGSMRQGGSNSSVLSRLASIIDMDDIGAVTCPLDSSIIFDPKAKNMFGNSLTVRVVSYDNYYHKVERKNLEDLGHLALDVYYTKSGSDPFKDRYLYEENGKFVLINIKEGADLDNKGSLVLGSDYKIYEDVTVPQDRLDIYLAEASGITESDDGAVKVTPAVDHSANRKANKQIVLHTLTGNGTTYDYKFSTEDVYITDLFGKYSNKTVVYTTGGDRETLSNLLAVFPPAMLALNSEHYYTNFVKACTHMKMPVSNRITGVLIAQENLHYIQNSSKYISMADLVVSSYNPKTSTVVFSDLMKFAATNSFLWALYEEKFGKNCGKIANSNTGKISDKLQAFAEFGVSYYYRSGYYSGYSSHPPKDIMRRDSFLKDAIYFQLYKAGILESSDEAIDDLKASLNAKVPEYLCDTIDEIDNVEILNLDIVKEYMKLFDYYAKHGYLLELLSYNSQYDTDALDRMAPGIIEFYKHVNEYNI